MMDMEISEIQFSFIVPVHNEQDGLEAFYRRLSAVADELVESYEIIFVNDGSTDTTGDILSRLSREDDRVKVVEFSRNFGHQAAVTAGYDYSSGRVVISLDGDGQHPPEIIPELVARWREGYEIVYTVRRDTDGISFVRRAAGRLAYRIIKSVSGLELTDQADFRLMDRKAVSALCGAREQARFVRGLVSWIGFRQIAVPYVAQKRIAGQSSYTFTQLMRMSAAGVFNFSLLPLRLPIACGGLFIVAALVYALANLLLWPLGLAAGAMAHLVMLGIGLFGLQMLVLGLMGEYIGRIFEEAKSRPLYIVRQTVGLEKNSDDLDAGLKKSPQRETIRFTVMT